MVRVFTLAFPSAAGHRRESSRRTDIPGGNLTSPLGAKTANEGDSCQNLRGGHRGTTGVDDSL